MANDFLGSLRLGRFVEQRRNELVLTREQLGERTGYSYNMIAKIELGRRMIPHDRMPTFAAALGVSTDELYAASGVLPPDIQGHVPSVTADQIAAVRQIMVT